MEAEVKFTKTELEIIGYVADGRSTKEIAIIRNTSIKTVEVQRHSIMRRANCRGMTELIVKLFREGIIK
jgi:DNA-binding CsgD family transcriptional regulator